MDDMNLTAGVTLALLIQYFIFSLFVGAARYKTGIKAPATTGDPFFEATFRVQHNTLEQLIHVIPALWICCYLRKHIFSWASPLFCWLPNSPRKEGSRVYHGLDFLDWADFRGGLGSYT
jgi:hypothetical protein